MNQESESLPDDVVGSHVPIESQHSWVKRVLVLGAGGYVGRRVVKALRECEWADPIPALRRVPQAYRDPSSIQLDATNVADLSIALRHVDAVVNCVAGSPATIVAEAKALQRAISDAEHSVSLVHFSSMAVYGDAVGYVGESHPLSGSGGGYARAKVQAEQILAMLPQRVILRPGCIYGPGSPQWSWRIAQLLRARRIGDLGSAGDGYSNLVYIDDVVQAVLASLQLLPSDNAAVFNLAMPGAPSWNEYFVSYGRALGAVPVARIGRRRLQWETHFFAPLIKIAEAVLGSHVAGLPPAIPPSLVRLWQQDIRLDSQAASRTLAIHWTPLAQGLASASAIPPDLMA